MRHMVQSSGTVVKRHMVRLCTDYSYRSSPVIRNYLFKESGNNVQTNLRELFLLSGIPSPYHGELSIRSIHHAFHYSPIYRRWTNDSYWQYISPPSQYICGILSNISRQFMLPCAIQCTSTHYRYPLTAIKLLGISIILPSC